ncbi:MAG: hypothetical protein DWQ01_18970 [Planctomycetota bacterium]|nr:MAG: hypothetical protein DWQ01_18970 [Planctomycetota bacterium]
MTTRRFAAAHQSFVDRDLSLVRIFHSPAEALQVYAEGEQAVPFPVLADPERKVYGDYGLGQRKQKKGLWKPRALGRSLGAIRKGWLPNWRDTFRDGVGGVPGDFLIAEDGRLQAIHLGADFTDSLQPDAIHHWLDQWPPESVLGPVADPST